MFGKERGQRRKTRSFESMLRPMALATGAASGRKQVCRDVGRAVDCGGLTTYVQTYDMGASLLTKKISSSSSMQLTAADGL